MKKGKVFPSFTHNREIQKHIIAKVSILYQILSKAYVMETIPVFVPCYLYSIRTFNGITIFRNLMDMTFQIPCQNPVINKWGRFPKPNTQ